MIDWKRSWYKLPFLPFRVFLLLLSYYVFNPLAKGTEFVGSLLPGLERKYK